MTDTKIPMRIFTSYEALTEYYGERPDMELGLYASDENLLVGHAPTPESFNPQYFTGHNELMSDYVPESPIDYTVTATSNNETYGYVTGGGTYPQHSEITLNAYAYYGYKFDKWSNGVETSAYTFAVEEDADLTAYFEEDPYAEPFYVENISNGVETLTIDKKRESSLPSTGDPSPDITVEYSTDKTTWTSLGTTTYAGPALTKSLNPGDKVYLRANTTRWGTNNNKVKIYNNITGISRVGGNIMSLLYGSNFTGQEKTFRDTIGFDFYRLFYQNSVLLDSSKLICPAETLYVRSYVSMFAKCPNLVTSPILDFTNMIAIQSGLTVDGACCGWMFENDTSLVNVPELKPITTVSNCYNGMFKGCTSLDTAPELPATTLTESCYKQMFYGCTSLNSAPELPATTLTTQCYEEMFSGCTLLNTIKCLATGLTSTTTRFTTNWMYSVPSGGTFCKKAGTTWPTGTNGIPTGWTVVEEPVS